MLTVSPLPVFARSPAAARIDDVVADVNRHFSGPALAMVLAKRSMDPTVTPPSLGRYERCVAAAAAQAAAEPSCGGRQVAGSLAMVVQVGQNQDRPGRRWLEP